MIPLDLHYSQHLNRHENEHNNRNPSAVRIVNILYALFGLLDLLLVARVILHLAGANADNGVVRFIYGLSEPLVALFTNFLRNPVLSTTAVLEITTIMAGIAYTIMAWMLCRVILLWPESPAPIEHAEI
jgi:YGGT family